MKKSPPKNIVASIEGLLKNIMRERKVDYQFLLVRYAIERFLYRLSVSPFAKQFVLKGGNLFVIWQNGHNYRPTIDSDFLCFGNVSAENLKRIFAEICSLTDISDDGMIFDTKSIGVSAIREETKYGGTRITLTGYLGTARINLQFDIGVGDAITPPPKLTDFPVLLDGAIPKLKTYPMATVIAEKTEVMITRGILNSRMKDFYDIWLLSELFTHEYALLVLAVKNTFERRSVAIPAEIPEAFTEAFATDSIKVTQWKAFVRKNNLLNAPLDFKTVISRLADFLIPALYPPQNPPLTWLPDKGWI